MIRRCLTPVLATLLLLAAPAAAQPGDPVTAAMVATLDLCLRVLEGRDNWQSGLDALSYRTASNGGRVKPIGSAIVASSMGAKTVDGVPARLCEITASPRLVDKTALRAALAARSRGLPAMAEGPISGGGAMSGYADFSRSGLAVLALTDRPGAPTTTSVSVIWK